MVPGRRERDRRDAVAEVRPLLVEAEREGEVEELPEEARPPRGLAGLVRQALDRGAEQRRRRGVRAGAGDLDPRLPLRGNCIEIRRRRRGSAPRGRGRRSTALRARRPCRRRWTGTRVVLLTGFTRVNAWAIWTSAAVAAALSRRGTRPSPALSRWAMTTIVCGERPGTTARTFRSLVGPPPGIVASKSVVFEVSGRFRSSVARTTSPLEVAVRTRRPQLVAGRGFERLGERRRRRAVERRREDRPGQRRGPRDREREQQERQRDGEPGDPVEPRVDGPLDRSSPSPARRFGLCRRAGDTLAIVGTRPGGPCRRPPRPSS